MTWLRKGGARRRREYTELIFEPDDGQRHHPSRPVKR
jgi:hypothetical protein